MIPPNNRTKAVTSIFTTALTVLNTLANDAPRDCIPDIKLVLNLSAEKKLANTETTEFIAAIKPIVPVPNFVNPLMNRPNIDMIKEITLPNNRPALVASKNRTFDLASFSVKFSMALVTLYND